ncbi:enoyl-CoA hydratase/isomerase family protein [Methylobacter sp. YRD-M1]|uniref:enoyl-CoA hydratase/isomerase family protein n=1 Tax=Methylobacter sp. YRD-M1 TaxID=2911520 RepID=UPI00227D053B|nr:enoyl-CoA hydratase-related protein [Methylobacter sp. YRD-M1]WAK01057.1 enoyl-CoA hydratase-related protein [Methylobacter sp. YRD-M1]
MVNSSGIIKFSRKEDIAILTISNPPRNRLPDPIFVDPDVLHAHLHEEGLKGAILIGEGNNFCEGAAIDNNLPEDLPRRMNEGKRILDIIEESPVPVIAAINGACFGGGLELALACHIRILGQSAMLGFPEAELGIMPGLAGTLRLPDELGYSKALPMLLSSEYITADKAVEIGLAHYIVPRREVLDKAFDVLHQMLGNKSVKAINYIMRSVLAGRRMDRKAALELETELVVELVESQYNKRKIA